MSFAARCVLRGSIAVGRVHRTVAIRFTAQELLRRLFGLKKLSRYKPAAILVSHSHQGGGQAPDGDEGRETRRF